MSKTGLSGSCGPCVMPPRLRLSRHRVLPPRVEGWSESSAAAWSPGTDGKRRDRCRQQAFWTVRDLKIRMEREVKDRDPAGGVARLATVTRRASLSPPSSCLLNPVFSFRPWCLPLSLLLSSYINETRNPERGPQFLW